MKKLLLILIIILSTHICYSASGKLNLNVITEKINPILVEPGGEVSVTLQLTNNGEKLIDGVIINPKIDGPINLKSKDDISMEKSICLGCSKQVTYYFGVNPDTISGTYPIAFQINADSQLLINHLVNIKVTGKPDLIFFYDSDLSEIIPKQKFTAPLRFKNIGTGTANKIKITSKSDDFVLAGTNTFYIDKIDPNEEVMADIDFYISEDVNPNSYFIPLNIVYEDEFLGEYSAFQDLGIRITNDAVLNIQKIKLEPTLIKQGKEVLVYVFIENTGKGEAKNTQIITKMGDFEQKSYIGTIGSKDYEQIAFTFIPEVSGKKELVFNVSYVDDQGSHNIYETYPLNIKSNISAPFVFFLVFVLMAVGIIVFLYLKKRDRYAIK
jgi:hypothetical protein